MKWCDPITYQAKDKPKWGCWSEISQLIRKNHNNNNHLYVSKLYTLSSQHVGRPTNRKHWRVHFSTGTSVPKLNTTLGVQNKISHIVTMPPRSHMVPWIPQPPSISYRWLIEVPITKIRQLGSEFVVPGRNIRMPKPRLTARKHNNTPEHWRSAR